LGDDDPAVINTDPYDDGWLFELELSDSTELDGLKDAELTLDYLKTKLAKI